MPDHKTTGQPSYEFSTRLGLTLVDRAMVSRG
jgi:hypothetical protein